MKIKSTNLNIYNLNLLLAKLLRPSAGGAVLCPFYQKVEAPRATHEFQHGKRAKKKTEKKGQKKEKRKTLPPLAKGRENMHFWFLKMNIFPTAGEY